MKLPIQNWGIDNKDKILKSAISGMNKRADKEIESLPEKDSSEIVLREALFKRIDNSYSFNKILFKKAEIYIGTEFSGTVIDMGAGRGTCSAIMTQYPKVEKVYAVEYSYSTLENIFPLAIKRVKGSKEKVTLCHGSFNDVKLSDNSVDFVVEGGSYHHSEDIEQTLQETFRILKPGGWFVGIDRSWPDEMSEDELDKIRYKELSKKQKELYGLPIDKVFTRADWGEHEYHHSDWLSYLEKIGFKSKLFYFESVSYRNPINIFKIFFFKLFGNYFLKRKDKIITYPNWIDRRKSISLIIGRKPIQ